MLKKLLVVMTMQLSIGSTILASELYSSDGVLRNTDVIVNEGNVFAGGGGAGVVGFGVIDLSIYNPPASNRLIFIDQVILTTEFESPIYLLLGDAGYGTYIDNWDNLKAYGAVGVATIQFDGNGSSGGRVLWNGTVPAGIPFTIKLPYPFLLVESSGLVVRSPLTTNTMQVFFYGREFEEQ